MSSHPLEALSALLDGELPDAERRAVEAHLASCPSCARHLRELGAMDALARGLPPVAAPEGYLDALPARVRQRIRADRPAPARAAPWVWPLAAGLALAVLAPIVLRDGPAPSRHAPEARTAEAVAPPSMPTAPAEARDEGTDAGLLARARQDTAPRAAPAAPPEAPPLQSAKSVAAADAPAASAVEMRDDADARERDDQPAFAPPPAAEHEEAKRADAQVPPQEQARGQAAGGVSTTLRKSERANVAPVSAEESAFRSLAALPLSSRDEARRARQAWIRFAADFPRGARLDEARVRVVEAAVAAFRAGGEPADRLAAQKDAAEYLSTGDAPQAARVQAALRRLEDPR